MAAGNVAAALDCYQRGVDVTPAMARQVRWRQAQLAAALPPAVACGAASMSSTVSRNMPLPGPPPAPAFEHGTEMAGSAATACALGRRVAYAGRRPWRLRLTAPLARRQVIDALKAAGVEYLVAPYEADAQVGEESGGLGRRAQGVLVAKMRNVLPCSARGGEKGRAAPGAALCRRLSPPTDGIPGAPRRRARGRDGRLRPPRVRLPAVSEGTCHSRMHCQLPARATQRRHPGARRSATPHAPHHCRRRCHHHHHYHHHPAPRHRPVSCSSWTAAARVKRSRRRSSSRCRACRCLASPMTCSSRSGPQGAGG